MAQCDRRLAQPQRKAIALLDGRRRRKTHRPGSRRSRTFAGRFQAGFSRTFRLERACRLTDCAAITWDPYGKAIRLVDIEKNETVRTFTAPRDVDRVIVSPDGSHLFAMGTNQGGWLWNINEEQPVASFDAARSPVAFNSDASLVFFRTKEGGQLHDLKQRKTVKGFNRIGDREGVTHVAYTTDGIRIFVQGLCHVRLWDIDGDAPLRTYERDRRITEVVFSADGNRLITWHEPHQSKGDVYLWDANHAEPRGAFRREDDLARAVFSPDARRILSWSGSHEGSARLWDGDTGKPLRVFRRHGHIADGRFTADGQRVLTITWEHKAHLLDSDQEEPLRTFSHTAWFSVSAFVDNGGSLIAQGDDNVMRWNIAVDRRHAIEGLMRDYEVKTATRLDDSGRLVPLSIEEWRQRRAAKAAP